MAMISDKMKRQLALHVLQNRYWQHIVNEHLKKNAFPVPVHKAIGHEAVAVAVSSMMWPDDVLALSHRNIAYNLARAGALQPVIDEYKRLPTGLGSGHLGSMNLSNPERGLPYTSSILGNNVSVATGMALGLKMKNISAIAAVVTGDGAMEEGPFYESLVLARSQKLRVIFIVENNNYSMSSTIPERRCPIAVDKMAGAYDIPYFSLSGNNIFEYAAKLADVRKQVIETETPAVVEAFVTNHYRHAGPTPGWPSDPMVIDFVKHGMIVANDERDPVFVLKNAEPQLYAELESQVLAEKWSF